MLGFLYQHGILPVINISHHRKRVDAQPPLNTKYAFADCQGSSPALPSDIVDRILDVVKDQWRARPQMQAKDEVSTHRHCRPRVLHQSCVHSKASCKCNICPEFNL